MYLSAGIPFNFSECITYTPLLVSAICRWLLSFLVTKLPTIKIELLQSLAVGGGGDDGVAAAAKAGTAKSPSAGGGGGGRCYHHILVLAVACWSCSGPGSGRGPGPGRAPGSCPALSLQNVMLTLDAPTATPTSQHTT